MTLAATSQPSSAAGRRWRPTLSLQLNGLIDVTLDDWTLEDSAGRPLARIYRFLDGPNAGRWAWFIEVDLQGLPFDGDTGTAATGTEARDACEALVSRV